MVQFAAVRLSVCLFFAAHVTAQIQPRITATAPEIAHVGQPLHIRGEGLCGSEDGLGAPRPKAAFTTPGNGIVTAPATLGPEDGVCELLTTVPRGAVEGELRVELHFDDGSMAVTPPFPMRVLPRLRLRPDRFELAAGESVRIRAVFVEDPRPRPLVWFADGYLGTVDAEGVYIAPSWRIDRTVWARVRACYPGTRECGSVVLAVHPFRVEPPEPTVFPGESLQLETLVAGTRAPAVWRALTPNVTVTPGGLVRGGSGPLDAGVGEVEATCAGMKRRIRVQVVGAPGAAARVIEPYDWLGEDLNSATGRMAYGSHPKMVAVWREFAYVASSSLPYGYQGAWQDSWIDVYWLGDYLRPEWVTAMECPSFLVELFADADRLYVVGADSPQGETFVTEWDLTGGGLPRLTERRAVRLGGATWHTGYGAVRYGIDGSMTFPHSIFVMDFASAYEPLPVALDYPLERTDRLYPYAVGGNRRFVYVTAMRPFGPGPRYEILAFDRSTGPARFLGAFEGGGWNRNLVVAGEVLVAGPDIFRIDGDGLLSRSAVIPAQRVIAVDAVRPRVLAAADTGLRVVDLTDPAAPRWTGAAAGSRISSPVAALGEHQFVSVGGAAGLDVYPIVWKEGPEVKARFGGARNLYDHRILGRYAYLAGGPGVGAFGSVLDWAVFQIFDVSGAEPVLVGRYERPGNVATGVEVRGATAYLALKSGTVLLDVSEPADPRKTGTLPHRGAVLAAWGAVLAVADYDRTLSIYDVTEPGAPRLAAQASLRSSPSMVRVRGGVTAVAYGGDGFDLFHTPTGRLLAECRQAPAADIALSAAYLYAAAGYSGVAIFDIANPHKPRLVGQKSLSFGHHDNFVPYALSIDAAEDGMVYVGTGGAYAAVFALDARDASIPRIVQLVRHGNAMYGQAIASVTVRGDDVFLGGIFQDEFCIVRQNNGQPVNLGLYEADQTHPLDVLPDRREAQPNSR